ncbi:MAG: hypothetical protein IKK33_08380 [Lachnospiraceae bacterium]|nr:hypothetical protein [Lachnospiraceae bacterium]
MSESSVTTLIESIKQVNNPIVKSKRLSFYISDLLKNHEITLYEAYVLNKEVIKLQREWYMLPAWNGWSQISTCLQIMNQRLLAVAFKELDYAEQLKQWGQDAFRLCKEKRKHYIMDRFEEFINIDENADILLRELLDVRNNYRKMSSNEGPYHVESFPYHYFEPERILLGKRDLSTEKKISGDIKTIIAELNN